MAGNSFARVIPVDEAGNPLGSGNAPKAYPLLNNAAATGAAVANIEGGDYVWSVEGTVGGATLTLQRQKHDGSWGGLTPAATLTAEGQVNVGIGQGATLRVLVSGGTPSALYSDLSGLS